ncbi:MAG: cation:dicarboxylase symporter family transporter [Treponema sp.]|jgi:Na+/H+-dicarboxylate symporter|nr:cation:dicarboxylase symporter family transporter [Treponema sp.]
MKVWIKLLVGSVLGIVLGFLLPGGNQTLLSALTWLEKLALGIGRYAVVPVLFFSLTIAVYELRQDGQFWPLVFKNFLFIIGVSLFIIASGILATLFFVPARIPIEGVEQLEVISLNTAENITDLFPSNMFSVLAGDGVYLFPICVFAFFFGIGLSYDRNYTKPVIALADSLSRIFYHIASFFSEIIGFIIIVLAAYWAIRFHAVLRAEVFRDLIILLGAFSFALGFCILPLFLYFLKPRVNPWIVLYGSLGPALAAFFSGDINFSLPVLIRHTKENFGIRRRSNMVTLTLFGAFCRAGSAVVAAAAFIVIIKSYSYLKIPALDLVSIGLRAFLISFLLARHPGDGAWTALAALCLAYGRGFEAGYLILKPLAFYLIAVGTFLDVTISSFAAYTVARISGFLEEKNVAHFI